MRTYISSGQSACGAGDKTAFGLTGATTIRPRICQLILGSSASPADNALTFLLQRFTAAGTSTAITPQKIDSADPVSLAAAGIAHTTEPTYTANAYLLRVAMNQRSTLQWIPHDARAELVIPAVANNGIGLIPNHASFTGNVDFTVTHSE
jgi:hypothetical protein